MGSVGFKSAQDANGPALLLGGGVAAIIREKEQTMEQNRAMQFMGQGYV